VQKVREFLRNKEAHDQITDDQGDRVSGSECKADRYANDRMIRSTVTGATLKNNALLSIRTSAPVIYSGSADLSSSAG
jgi:hypothetical protein